MLHWSVMMRIITILVVVGCIAYSQTEQCCLPSQMQASLLIGFSYVPVKKDNMHVNYFLDSQNKRARMKFDYGETLVFFNEGVDYWFNETMCSKGSSVPWNDDIRCVPKNAEASKPYRLGWNQNITLVDYYWQEENVYVQMSMSNCSTPTEMIYLDTTSGESYLTRIVYQDYVPTIVDEHTFDVPDICKKTLMMKENQKSQLGNFKLGRGMFSKKLYSGRR